VAIELDYASRHQGLPPRHVLRGLTLLMLALLIVFKCLVLFDLIRSIIKVGGQAEWQHMASPIIVILFIAADASVAYLLTKGWRRTTRWVWPVRVYISILGNLLLFTCCIGLAVSGGGRITPGYRILLPAIFTGFIYAALLAATCGTTDHDRRRQQRQDESPPSTNPV
jgi:hypothetical protein